MAEYLHPNFDNPYKVDYINIDNGYFLMKMTQDEIDEYETKKAALKYNL